MSPDATSSRQPSLHASHYSASSHMRSGSICGPFPSLSYYLLWTFSVHHHARVHAHDHGRDRGARAVFYCSLTVPQASPRHRHCYCHRCRCRWSLRSLRLTIRLRLEACGICSTLDLLSAEITLARLRFGRKQTMSAPLEDFLPIPSLSTTSSAHCICFSSA